MLYEMADGTSPQGPVKEATTVWGTPELLVDLLKHELETGYKLVTFYTACATAYVTIVGFAVKFYFDYYLTLRSAAVLISQFGLTLSLFSLIAPAGLELSRRDIAEKANRYATTLGLPEERFTVVRVGMWLSAALFAAIACAWVVLLLRASG